MLNLGRCMGMWIEVPDGYGTELGRILDTLITVVGRELLGTRVS